MIKTVEWVSEGVRMIDQLRLPVEEVYPVFRTCGEVAEAIRTMVVRGAPAIGVAAAMGIALGVKSAAGLDRKNSVAQFNTCCETLRTTRPTAVNLFWAIARMKKKFESLTSTPDGFDPREVAREMEKEALKIYEEDIACNKAMAEHGARLIPQDAAVLTHCNAGALATAGYYGTALGVIKAAHEQGKHISVWVDETRPYLQGARLTAWECEKEGIPHTLITDNMAGHFMKRGQVQCVVVGADRIAANGDTANKIGTYSLSVLAKEHHIPFFVVAPQSSIDPTLKSGEEIPIEERSSREVTHIRNVQIAPDGTRAAHPAFDVTPAQNIHNIITEHGILYKPFSESIAALFAE
ncbi:MAG: S-methyl-5-thioribose-1-phosphate isomerase [Acidobacteriia bacterium]|nr:S-methyl-5-thioribose-1-phosphate isomerase [Terriglobia bacterium]